MAAADTAATVLVTYRPIEGKEEQLEALVARGGAALDRLGLLTSDPHLAFRSAEGGKPILVEILTWKDPAVTADPPAEVNAIWGEMNQLVEPRGGRPGIEIQHLHSIR